MNEARTTNTLLRTHILRNLEFGSALSKFRNFWVGVVENPKNPTLGTPLLTYQYQISVSLLLCYILELVNSFGDLATIVGFYSELLICLVIGQLRMGLLCGTNKRRFSVIAVS
jgi:hypothetical protein